MSIVVWDQVAVLLMYMSYYVVWDRLYTLGRAPRTKETLPDFVSSVGLLDIHEYSAG